ncbi:MAG: 4-alpha-glucanotransferase [Oscillospiraceae bacterium]|nr:4-alpha-glucanotransferase [Oscillospiraceae bacterium]
MSIPNRAAGVLLPVASLPGALGIGTFGAAARRWIDFLSSAGQRYWQILPLGPTGYGDSPYQSDSAFAGNPWFIDLDELRGEGLLEQSDYAGIDWGDGKLVAYDALRANRERILRLAFERFEATDEYRAFCGDNAYWLDAYAEYTQKGEYVKFVQFKFFEQWGKLRDYAHSKDVEIIGDIPIYVSLHSSDVKSRPQWFQLDDNALPTAVAGCPPDSFSQTGQLWGNPLYDWDALRKDGYKWWISRIRAMLKLVDVLRIDHFRGLEGYYAIPAADNTAENGVWRTGPGADFIDAILRELPKARIIAEDLGFLTDGVRELMAHSGFPGMKVLQFAFDSRDANGGYLPHTYTKNCVVYTGTHDNDTSLGWTETAPPEDVALAMEYLGVKAKKAVPRALIRVAYQSTANLAVIPIQDWLELGSAARINTPSTVSPKNWSYRLDETALTPALAAEMRRMAVTVGR